MGFKRICQIIGYALKFNSTSRAKYIRRKRLFGSIGKDVRLPFMVLPLRCENIYLHNNIEIASGARFVVHDAIHGVFNRMDNIDNNYEELIGRIEIFDNVFIGANSIILPNVKIGPNSIVAAGSVVTKDVPPGKIVAGVPAKVIGSFFDLMEKRK